MNAELYFSSLEALIRIPFDICYSRATSTSNFSQNLEESATCDPQVRLKNLNKINLVFGYIFFQEL